jgi:exopolyphosphatase/guanosine-5'-triphosphate,3'-diphosphate pyrophosphatase
LVTLADGEMGQQATMPIGPLRLMDGGGEKLDKIEKIIDKNLSALGWLGQKRMPNFYAVGGSFRMLAKMHMQRENYPLNIVHGYRVAASDMQKLIKEVLAMPVDKIAEIPGVASKRAGSVQPAALMLDRIINISHCEYVVFSVSGIREGYLYEKLSPYIQTQDALIASAVDLVMHDGKSLEYAKELCEWMTPLFPKEKVADYRLRLAICILSEIAYSIHTEYRAEGAFGRIIQSMLKSHSHTERVMMAVALYHRHQFKMKNNNKLLTLIDDKTRARARVIGVAANLAFHLSGGEAGALSDIKLRIEKNGKTNITIPKDLQNLMGDAVQKRIDGLSEAFKAFSSATR